MGKKNVVVQKNFCKENKNIGRVNPDGGGADDLPPQKIVRLKLCGVVVSIAVRFCITNFRPQGPIFLVEFEFLWWVGGVN